MRVFQKQAASRMFFLSCPLLLYLIQYCFNIAHNKLCKQCKQQCQQQCIRYTGVWVWVGCVVVGWGCGRWVEVGWGVGWWVGAGGGGDVGRDKTEWHGNMCHINNQLMIRTIEMNSTNVDTRNICLKSVHFMVIHVDQKTQRDKTQCWFS